MIEFVKGNLLNCEANIIVHNCNCFHTFGAGIAKTIKQHFPEAYNADKATPYGDEKKLGTFSFAKVNKKVIVNLYGQFNYSRTERMLNYEAFYKGLELLKERLSTIKDREIVLGFPHKIGCNLAGGNWNIVRTMIEEVFTSEPYRILIVQFK